MIKYERITVEILTNAGRPYLPSRYGEVVGFTGNGKAVVREGDRLVEELLGNLLVLDSQTTDKK